MILVTGAVGKTGRAVIQALATRKVPVRAFVRRMEQVAAVQRIGATEAIVGDLRNQDDLESACQGIETLYHICPNMQPDEVAIAERIFAAAKRSDIPRVVYHSVLHPQTASMPHHWQKNRVEELLFTTGFDYTILQPAAYMQNVLASWQTIIEQGMYAVPYALSTRLGMVDLHDVAEAAAFILTTRNHSGATYELATDEWLTQSEVAAILSEVLGRPVRAEVQPRQMWEQNARSAGLSDYAIATLRNMFMYYERYGFCGNGNTLCWLLGRTPTRFSDCMKRYTKQGKSR